MRLYFQLPLIALISLNINSTLFAVSISPKYIPYKLHNQNTATKEKKLFLGLGIGNQPLQMKKMDIQYFLRDRQNQKIDSIYKTTGGINNVFGMNMSMQFITKRHSIGIGAYYMEDDFNVKGFTLDYFRVLFHGQSFHFGLALQAGYRNDKFPLGIMNNNSNSIVDINNKQFFGGVTTNVSIGYISTVAGFHLGIKMIDHVYITGNIGYSYNAMIRNKLMFEGYTTSSSEIESTNIDLKSASLYKYLYPDMNFSRFNYTDVKAIGLVYSAGIKVVLHYYE